MAKADSAHTTTLSDLSPSADKVVRLFHTPAGLSTERPQVELPPIDRRAVMTAAHVIAKRALPHSRNYKEAMRYGLRTSWQLAIGRRECAMLRAQVAHRTHTAKQIAANRAATRRCGSSYMPF
jgi:hypothetical protein